VKEKKLIRVRDVMKNEFDIVDGMETVEHALNTMAHLETKTLIIKKRHDNDEYGMVTLSDIARHVLAMDRSPNRVNVYEIMSKPVITVCPDMDIRYCARLFSRFNLTRAPVIENGDVIGLVSFTDMVVKGLRSQ
jgi:predicted transcriptional regulator